MGNFFSTIFREDCVDESNSSSYLTPTEYFIQRFSLCVLDIIRRLQLHPKYENGIEKCHIMEYLVNQNFLDGDISSQVTTALIELESNGLIMHTINGYKTLGPFAKLCLAKNPKQRRLAWEKLEANLNGDANSSTDMMHPTCPSKKTRKS